MEIQTGQATQCGGGNHRSIPVTINGVTKDVSLSSEDMADLLDRPDTEEEIKQRIRYRLISAVRESGATTGAQIRNAMSNKTFEI